MILDQFNLRDTISFQTYAMAFTGTLDRVKAVAVLDTQSVAAQGVDVAAEHANVIALFPEGVVRPNSPFDYEWLKVTLADGQNRYIGLPWIVPTSITRHTTTKFVIELAGVDPTQKPLVEQALSANGFVISKFTIQ